MSSVLLVVAFVSLVNVLCVFIVFDISTRTNSKINKLSEEINEIRYYMHITSASDHIMLWKTRQDISIMQEKYIQREQYEDAEVLKQAIKTIDVIIHIFEENADYISNEIYRYENKKQK